jgi:hemolysin activation/secretion protein
MRLLNKSFFPYTLLILSQSALAVPPPSAGSQMQQLPPVPIPQKIEPKIEIQPTESSPAVPPASENYKMRVKSLRIVGAQVYSEAELLTMLGFSPNSELSLPELRGMAAKIADYYHQKDYFLAQAYLPVQDVSEGIVTIVVIVGQYGKISVNNESNLNNALAQDILSDLKGGDLITTDDLETSLLLLSDLPGIKVNSSLVPGSAVGTSDLNVKVTQGPRVTGSVDADNAGNRYTGMYRGGLTINFNEPFGQGDVASLRLLTAGSGLNYGRLSYQMQLGKTTLGAAYSYLAYELGKQFESLGAHGSAQIASIYGSYPLIRSRDNNLFVQLGFDERMFRDKTDVPMTVANKRAHVLKAGLYGDSRDTLWGGGLNAYSFTLTSGFLDIETPQVRTFDALTARTQGYYNKFSLYAMRLQNVTDYLALFASINGQVASKNLDVSEKMELGGMYGVRAYPEGETYADQAAIFTAEARFLLPKFFDEIPGQMQLIGFVDVGTAGIYQNPWSSGSNSRTLSGAGIGFNWEEMNNFAVKMYYAHKLGNEKALSAPDQSGQFWVQLVKYF